MIAGTPCVLIVDDDPVSLRFLEAAVERLGNRAATACDCASAMAQAGAYAVDLLLLDRRLPDGDGIGLLRALRALGVSAPAIASSAELAASDIVALQEVGFAGTLLKPASVDDIGKLLGRFLPARDEVAAPAQSNDDTGRELLLLDDAAALSAIGGDRKALLALRQLFARELEAIERDLRDAAVAAHDSPSLAARLHRLRASCGFCGAAELGATAARLQHALASGDAPAADLQAFLSTCHATRLALAAAP